MSIMDMHLPSEGPPCIFHTSNPYKCFFLHTRVYVFLIGLQCYHLKQLRFTAKASNSDYVVLRVIRLRMFSNKALYYLALKEVERAVI